MTAAANRPAPLQPDRAIDTETATEILRMLTAECIDPMPRCRADGAAASR